MTEKEGEKRNAKTQAGRLCYGREEGFGAWAGMTSRDAKREKSCQPSALSFQLMRRKRKGPRDQVIMRPFVFFEAVPERAFSR
jgi:hypothetical protein